MRPAVRPVVLVAFALAACAAAGCAGGDRAPLPADAAASLSPTALSASLRALRVQPDTTGRADRVAFVTARAGEAGLTPALGGRFAIRDGRHLHAAALLAGRQPGLRDTLVTVVVPLGGAGAAAALEAARVLALRSPYHPAPGRSVLFAFVDPRSRVAPADVVAGWPVWAPSQRGPLIVVRDGGQEGGSASRSTPRSADAHAHVVDVPASAASRVPDALDAARRLHHAIAMASLAAPGFPAPAAREGSVPPRGAAAEPPASGL